MASPGQQDWSADTTVVERHADRLRVKKLLSDGQTMFRKLLVPQSLGPNEMDKLLNRFDKPTLDALISLFYELDRALFEQPQNIFSFGETGRRYLIQFLSDSDVSELGIFTDKIFDPEDKTFPCDAREIVDFFKEWLKRAATGVDTPFISDPSASERSARRRWGEELRTIANHFDDNLEAGKAAGVAAEAAERATRAADHAQMAAGDTAQYTLGNHFNRIANRERWWALGWTAVTILSVVVVVMTGLRIVSAAVGQDWLKTVFHLVLVLPILGLASYTASIAKNHRQLERWATTAYVQIRTVGAYSDLLPSSASGREQLVMDLGKNIFATPVFGEDPKSERVASVPADLLDALKEVARALASKAVD